MAVTSTRSLGRAIAAVLLAGLALSLYVPAAAHAGTYRSDEGGFKVVTSSMKRPTVLKKGAPFTVKGTLKDNRKIAKLVMDVTDLNRFSRNVHVVKRPGKKRVSLRGVLKPKKFAHLSSGEKQLRIVAYDTDGNSVQLTRRFTVLGKAKEPVHMTGKCAIKATRGSVRAVTDSSDNTCWGYGTMTIKLPKDKVADGILVKWFEAWNTYKVTSYDKKGKKLDSYDSESYRMLHRYFALDEDARTVKVKVSHTVGARGIASLRVYEKDKVGVSVERWKAPKAGKCDLLVVSSHRDDELLYFGGTIPYYQSVKGKNVYVMYMSGADRLRHREALAGQWALGNTTYPIFMNFPGGYHDGVSGTLDSWGGESYVVGRLVEQIRRCKPKVIVTHDFGGEYGHPTHKTTPRVVKKAIKAAKSKSKYRASAKKYGTWKVKKLYAHMYGKRKVRMNYGKPAAELDWKTPYQAACVAFDKHVSQHGRWSMRSKVVTRYPSTRYGLVYTRVGPDKKKRDFFEHVK